MGPQDRTATFLKRSVASERSDNRSGQFCVLLLADKAGPLHTKTVPRSHNISQRNRSFVRVELLIRVNKSENILPQCLNIMSNQVDLRMRNTGLKGIFSSVHR